MLESKESSWYPCWLIDKSETKKCQGVILATLLSLPFFFFWQCRSSSASLMQKEKQRQNKTKQNKTKQNKTKQKSQQFLQTSSSNSKCTQDILGTFSRQPYDPHINDQFCFLANTVNCQVLSVITVELFFGKSLTLTLHTRYTHIKHKTYTHYIQDILP